MIVIVQEKYFSVEQCKANPNNLYVFGDNTIHKGKAGQAVIRDCPNAVGIPTKRYPSMKIGSFFTDTRDDLADVLTAIRNLKVRAASYEMIVFPAAGLGTGLAKLKEHSPIIHRILNDMLTIIFKKENLV